MIITIPRQFLRCCHEGKSRFESSPGSLDECRRSAKWLPTLRPNQSTWPMSPPVYRLQPSTYTIAICILIITQPASRYSCYRPTGEGGRPRRTAVTVRSPCLRLYIEACLGKHDRPFTSAISQRIPAVCSAHTDNLRRLGFCCQWTSRVEQLRPTCGTAFK